MMFRFFSRQLQYKNFVYNGSNFLIFPHSRNLSPIPTLNILFLCRTPLGKCIPMCLYPTFWEIMYLRVQVPLEIMLSGIKGKCTVRLTIEIVMELSGISCFSSQTCYLNLFIFIYLYKRRRKNNKKSLITTYQKIN